MLRGAGKPCINPLLSVFEVGRALKFLSWAQFLYLGESCDFVSKVLSTVILVVNMFISIVSIVTLFQTLVTLSPTILQAALLILGLTWDDQLWTSIQAMLISAAFQQLMRDRAVLGFRVLVGALVHVTVCRTEAPLDRFCDASACCLRCSSEVIRT